MVSQLPQRLQKALLASLVLCAHTAARRHGRRDGRSHGRRARRLGRRPPPHHDHRWANHGGCPRHVELPGMTLLPGLIDMHVHLTSDPHYSGITPCNSRIIFGPWSASQTRRRRSKRDSRPCATWVPITTTMSRSSKASKRGSYRVRASCRRPMRSARPAAIATRPNSRRR